jgi:EAL domain-containing protein (putative c-di-GMP-specific phosphodiesterase class I)
MEQLGRVAFTELKIDRSFVAAMNERMEARTIVESSIHIAHRLGMVSVAEGIETAEQLDALTEAGCDVAQGYYISKPLTGEEFRALNPEGPL